MQIKNPTKEKISVVIEGEPYTIEAEGTLKNVSAAHANYWKSMLHNFLQLKKDANEEETPKVEVPAPQAPIVEEIIEDEEEVEDDTEEVEEAPTVEVTPTVKK